MLPVVPGVVQLPEDGYLKPEFTSFNTGKHTLKLFEIEILVSQLLCN